jgi:myo-inositol-1(or 4)-monophosphatase
VNDAASAQRSTPSYDELLDLATRAAVRAGRFLVEQRPAELAVAATKTSPTDVVTEMDRRCEALIAAELLGARPDDSVLGEEAGEQGVSPRASGPVPGQVRWIVDPIDGTVNYLYGLAHWAVSVAAEVDGRTVAGVVHAPALGHTWTATVATPARRDGQVVRVSACSEVSQALVATGFGYQARQRAVQGALVARLLPLIRDIRRDGAASLDLCAVASGWVDAYYESGLAPWDLAAGALIARRAGARVGGLSGAPPGPAMVIAAPPGLFDQLETLVGGGLPASAGATDRRAGHKPTASSVAPPQPGATTGGDDDGN